MEEFKSHADETLNETEAKITDEHRLMCYNTVEQFLAETCGKYEKQAEKVIRDITAIQEKWLPAFNFMQDARCRAVLDQEIAKMMAAASHLGNREVRTRSRIATFDYQLGLFPDKPDDEGEDIVFERKEPTDGELE